MSEKLTSSATASGPTAIPARRPAFSMSGGGTPSASIASPSFTYDANTRLVKNPRASLTTIGVLPMKRT